MSDFEIREARKAALGNSHIVIRNKKIYLRIWDNEIEDGFPYVLVTATASDDTGYGLGNFDLSTSCKAAQLATEEFGLEPTHTSDRAGRPYVILCSFRIESISNDEDFLKIISKYFEFFDGLGNDIKSKDTGSSSDLIEIYESLAINNGPVYLSDGLWLNSDGTMTDEKR